MKTSAMAATMTCAVLLGGCASNMAPTSTVGYMPNGSYVLADYEKSMPCKSLTSEIKRGAADIASTREMANLGTGLSVVLAVASFAATRSASFRDVGADQRYQANREMARLRAYNGALEMKKCRKVDIDAEIAAASNSAETGKKPKS